MTNDSCFNANRELWNVRTPLHVESDFYNVAAFKAGESSLCGIETEEIGSVRGKSVLHLQCHFRSRHIVRYPAGCFGGWCRLLRYCHRFGPGLSPTS